MSLSPREFKSSIFEQFARIGKVVSSPQRHEILDLLCQGEHTVETLARKSGMSVANTSRHLQILRSTRFVATRKEATYVYYRLADDEVCDFLNALRSLAESRLAEVEQIARDFLAEHGQFERLEQDDLIRRVLDSDVTVLDVRPPDEYAQGHLPGAVSVPLSELKQRIDDLPRDREVVAYCRGPYCVLAVEAVELLREAGIEAVRLEPGVQDWRALGLDVEVGT